MTLKFTKQGDRTLARRWTYSKEAKRSLPVTILSVKSFMIEETLSDDVIKRHNVTSEEIQQYSDFITKENNDRASRRLKYSATDMSSRLKGLIQVFEAPDALSELTLEDLETASDHANELKKLITREKNKRKRRAK